MCSTSTKSRVLVQVTLPNYYFHFAREFTTLVLAHKLDSLVRVSRRDREKRHFRDIIEQSLTYCSRVKIKTAGDRKSVNQLRINSLTLLSSQNHSRSHYRTQLTECSKTPHQLKRTVKQSKHSAYLSAISVPFNSLFKVLFIFPSRYLYAIGISFVFSFR